MANPTPAPPLRGWKRIPRLAGLALLALGGAGLGAGCADAAGSTPAEVEHVPGVVAVEPIVVALADAAGDRYLRCTVRIVLDRREEAARVEADPLLEARLRDRVLSVLGARTAEELSAPTGRDVLEAKIIEGVGPLFTEARVLDVYFTEFLLQ